MVVVTHEMEFARHVSNHVIFLHKGLIEEQGRRPSCSATPKPAPAAVPVRRVEVTSDQRASAR